MTTNNPLLKQALITLLFFFSLAPSLGAQTGRRVTEPLFIQRLAWVGDEFVFRYEVVIERKEKEEYRAFRKESTELPKIQVALPRGSYRYRVIPYDFFDQPGEASDWVIIEDSSIIVMSVEVRTEDDVFTLLPVNGQLFPGINGIIIKNPDELETEKGMLIVEKQKESGPGPEKQVEMFVGTAWAPLFPMYGAIEQVFGQKLFFQGATLRLGFIFTEPRDIKPGFELSTSWYALDKAFDTGAIKVQTGLIDCNILFQERSSNQKMAATFRIGGGLAFQIGDLSNEQESYLLDRLAPHVNMDISFLWFALTYVYFETGLNYTHFLTTSDSSGYLRPWIGIGWRL
ncbi:MAG: hypothetical protein LBB89_11435 [Treponema sp.]|jgi:hypothetical protein|nr:hypothetical protein [Treponema sp.]